MFRLLILLHFTVLESNGQDTCPKANVPSCQKSEMMCISPPSFGDQCSKLECIQKKYKNPLNPKKKCKASCPRLCGEDYITCQGPPDDQGCLSGEICLPNTQCVGHHCQTHCPIYCDEGFKVCPGGTDTDGCPVKDFCIPKTNGDCCNHCPCPKDMYTCPEAGVSEDGCPLPPVCVANDSLFSCTSEEAVVLVFGGGVYYREHLLKAYLFNNSECPIRNLPKESDSGAGALLNNSPMYCGGIGEDRIQYKDCFKLQRNGHWTKLGYLNEARSRHAAVTVTNKMVWITGGTEQNLNDFGEPSHDDAGLNSTEIVFENGTVIFGPELPEPVWGHCSVMTDMGLIFLIGGATGRTSNYTLLESVWIYNSDLEFIQHGPPLSQLKGSLSCITAFQNHFNRQVLLVSIGSMVAILDYSVIGSSWTLLPPLPVSVGFPGMFQMPGSDKVVLFNKINVVEMSMKDGVYSYTNSSYSDDYKRWSPMVVMVKRGCV